MSPRTCNEDASCADISPTKLLTQRFSVHTASVRYLSQQDKKTASFRGLSQNAWHHIHSVRFLGVGSELLVAGLGFRLEGLEFRVSHLGCRAEDSG